MFVGGVLDGVAGDFFWTGDEFVISTATTSPKVAALSACPQVALAIDAGDTPGQARALSVRGHASIEIVDGVVPEYLAAAGKIMEAEAAAEFQKVIDHRGLVGNFPWGALARLGLARAYAVQGDSTKSQVVYREFLTLWKDADPDLPLLHDARAEYAKL